MKYQKHIIWKKILYNNNESIDINIYTTHNKDFQIYLPIINV